MVLPALIFASGSGESSAETKQLVEKIEKMEKQIMELETGGGDGPNCFKCHGSSETEYALLGAKAGYETSGHKNLGNSYYANGGGCQQCHTNEGFIEYVNNGSVDAEGYIAYPSQPGCFTCHPVHENFNFSLRTVNPVKLVSGDTFDMGDGNLCVNCHRARTAGATAAVETKANAVRSHFGGHHGPQGDMLSGSGAYEFAGKTYSDSVHTRAVADSCVTCHMALPDGRFSMAPSVGGHSFNVEGDVHEAAKVNTAGCITCHSDIKQISGKPYFAITAKADYDQDGKTETVQEEVEGVLGLFVNAKGTGALQKLPIPMYDAAGNFVTPRNEDMRSVNEMAALFNYKFVLEDRSKGVHNTKYAVQVLYDSLKALNTSFNTANRP
jgi:hypothetical protein